LARSRASSTIFAAWSVTTRPLRRRSTV